MDKQNALHYFLLLVITLKPQTAQAIAARLQPRIRDFFFDLNPESLVTALDRMERAGWLQSEWSQIDITRGKIYSLTGAGRNHLNAQRAAINSQLKQWINSDACILHSFSTKMPRNWN